MTKQKDVKDFSLCNVVSGDYLMTKIRKKKRRSIICNIAKNISEGTVLLKRELFFNSHLFAYNSIPHLQRAISCLAFAMHYRNPYFSPIAISDFWVLK